ncbi:methyltransferase domain-containing protein [Haloarchaeobius sp. DYHT-AS-18]|uniref:methyltransferase domain-containing protein n=1 Tax=Haloarchaeobius sp. DYHT-AS-18 TaxID=3446117 RepID=UPI003EBAF58F
MIRDDELLSTAGRTADFTERLLDSLAAAGCDLDDLTPADITVFEDLHVQGFEATLELAALADVDEESLVLDVAAGLGGPTRALADEFGCQVVGVDLTPAFCHAATELTRRVGLDDQVTIRNEHALDLPFEDDTFDVVFLQDLASDIEYKAGLAAELHRVLVPGGRVAVHEVVAGPVEPLLTPMALTAEGPVGSLVHPDEFLETMTRAGFEPLDWLDVSIEAAEWYHSMIHRAETEGFPPCFDVVVRDDLVPVCRSMHRNLDEDRARAYLGLFEK